MKKELEDKLYNAFPLLYAEKDSSMCWGFECNDGWFNLIWNLSEKLENLIKECQGEEYIPRAVQVKEKFGTLRFYMSFETDEMSKLINEAEKESATICELCGNKGKLIGKSWLSVKCDQCLNK